MRLRGLHGGWLPNWLVGLLVAAALLVLALFAFSGARLPFSGGFELRAAFDHTEGIETDSQVRIAGVTVGSVTEVESIERRGRPAALVTMRIDDEGLPIHSDAQLEIRPRLFLEGNYFVDLRPGSPGAPALAEGSLVPLGQTSASVALDQVFSTLQSDVRSDLRGFLDQFSRALVRDGGASGLRKLYASSPGAFRSTSQVAQAALGTEPHDLSALLGNLGSVTATLAENRVELAELVSNLRVVSGAFAVRREELAESIAELSPTIEAGLPLLTAVNESLPPTRAFAREALPGVRSLPPALEAATPLLRQVRGLVSEREGRGLIADLRPAVPELAALTERSVPLLEQSRALSSCFNEVVIPWANMTIEDPETPAGGRIFEETAYGLVGISGESRSGDANGPYARIVSGSGSNAVTFPAADGNDEIVGIAPLEILGARPALQSSARTPYRPEVACETNAPPDLDSGSAAPPPEQTPTSGPAGSTPLSPEVLGRIESLGRGYESAGTLARRRPGLAQQRREDALAELDRILAEGFGWERLLEGAER